MSAPSAIQQAIDFNSGTKAGRYTKSFVIKGKSGPADVPPGVHVRFYNCTISTLTMTKDSFVFMENGTVTTVTAGQGCRFSARGTKISGDVSLTLADGDLYTCIVNGQLKLLSKAALRADSCQIVGGAVGVDLLSGSQARVTRCVMTGHATAAVRADSKSHAILTKCTPVQGSQAALYAKDGSVIEAVECALVEGVGQIGVRTETSGRVECRLCTTVKGTVHAVKAETRGFVSLQSCDDVLGSGGCGVFLDSGAGAEVRLFKSLKGLGDSAVKCSGESVVHVASGLLIQSSAKDAVELAGKSKFNAVSVTALKGMGRHGVSLAGESAADVIRCTSIVGQGGHGALLAGKSRISLSEGTSVTGQAGDGVKADGESSVDVRAFAEVKGLAGSGVKLSGTSRVLLKDVALTEGLSTPGIQADGKSTVVAHGPGQVKGQTDGIQLSGESSAQVFESAQILGQSRHGVSASGECAVSLIKVADVTGAGGKGVTATLSRVLLSKVASITGAAGPGVSGINSTVRMDRCDSVVGSDIGAIFSGRGPNVDSVEIVNCPDISGSAVGLALEKVRAFTRGIVTAGSKALSLLNAHHETQSDTFNGDVDGTSSILLIRESEITGEVSWTDMAIFDLKGVHGSIVTMDNVGMLMAKTTLPQGSADSCGLIGAGATLGATDTVGGGVVLSGGAGNIKGDGAAVSLNAGVPEDGVDYMAMNSGTVKAQDQAGSYVRASEEEVQISSTEGSTVTVTQNIVDDAAAAFSAKGATTAKMEGTTLATVKSSVAIALDAPIVDVP